MRPDPRSTALVALPEADLSDWIDRIGQAAGELHTTHATDTDWPVCEASTCQALSSVVGEIILAVNAEWGIR